MAQDVDPDFSRRAPLVLQSRWWFEARKGDPAGAPGSPALRAHLDERQRLWALHDRLERAVWAARRYGDLGEEDRQLFDRVEAYNERLQAAARGGE